MKSKKIFSCMLASSLLVLPPAKNQVNASNISVLATIVSSFIAPLAPYFFYNLIHSLENKQLEIAEKAEIQKVSGFRKPKEIIEKIKELFQNKSKIKIYGQEKAKKQLYSALCSFAAKLDNIERGQVDKKDLSGNIIYLIGTSGGGKTTMADAIAKVFLRCPEKTFFSCCSESVFKGTDLGSQLFKTIVTKNIGQMRKLSSAFDHNSLTPKEEESPILKHIMKWCDGAVVLIDEYDKMKMMTKDSSTELQCDKSADELMRSIVSQGGYTFMGKWIDCSKILFLVTTNETRDELESNFGIGGVKGGGAQRLNIIEFEELSMDACRHIVDDMIRRVGEALVDGAGLYQLASINIDNNSVENMAQYIFDDKIMQGRAKYVIENKIYSLFSDAIGADCEKNIKLSCKYSSEDHEIEFTKTTIESCEEETALFYDFPNEKAKIHEGTAVECV